MTKGIPDLYVSFLHLLPLQYSFIKEQYTIFIYVFCYLHLLSYLFVSFIAQNLLHNNCLAQRILTLCYDSGNAPVLEMRKGFGNTVFSHQTPRL